MDMLYVAFLKAFDVVRHSIIMEKLKMLGIGGKLLVSIQKFLFGRTMCVKVTGNMGSQREVT